MCLRTLGEEYVPDRRSIPFFEKRHQHLAGLYAIIQGLKSEKEELQVNVAKLSKHLRKDLLELGKEVFEDEGDEMAPSVIRDLLEQVSEISRRYLEIRTKTDEDPKIPPIPLKEFDPVTTSYRTLSYTIPLYLNKLKKKLLILQDEVRDKRREKENREKSSSLRVSN